jgi:hypothetical protein
MKFAAGVGEGVVRERAGFAQDVPKGIVVVCFHGILIDIRDFRYTTQMILEEEVVGVIETHDERVIYAGPMSVLCQRQVLKKSIFPRAPGVPRGLRSLFFKPFVKGILCHREHHRGH